MFKTEVMFICGLVSFLIAHILYIITFSKAKKTDFSLSGMILLPVIGLSYFGILYPKILAQNGVGLLVGVFVYLLAILTMTYTGILNKNRPLTFGVLMFLLSDSLLAFDKFYVETPNVGYEVGVMITYHIAQFCIAKYHQ
ncbi:YhhN-like protein [Pilaira anomala]|nr:YhhN-like protein [Pilaira anomala]